MPILGQHHVAKPRREAVDQRNNFVALRNRERAARTEIVLNIDDNEDVIFAKRGAFVHDPTRYLRAFDCRRRSTSAASFTSSLATSTGYVAFGSRRRKASGKRSSSRLARSLMSARVSGACSRRPPCMTG